ncbi:ABC transporter ATP-binding protein [bacterium]|nr:ABC transporter ATP-binding protein [bacterium]
MKDDVILKVENLSKQYRLGLVGTGTISHDFNRFLARIRGKEDPYLKIGESNDRSTKGTSEYVWALKDINFEVKRGEILGIIGKNGAGKSTLLKILSKVTGPTTGAIKSKGRIASLLEVGTGFHPEMTGKENIFLNGAILGMTKKEISSKLDEIIEFSGCERYVETPVKRYSSGMKVRLAFAVAAFLEPDILVVDEVLAVGDAEFQKKAIGKMQDISSQGGRTVLFVSHNMAAVKSLCTRCVVLKDGNSVFDGYTEKAVDYYMNNNLEIINKTYSTSKEKYFFEKIWIDNNVIESGKTIRIFFKLIRDIQYKTNIHIGIYNSGNEKVLHVSSEYFNNGYLDLNKENIVCEIKKNPLIEGLYYMNLSIVINNNVEEKLDKCIIIEVINGDFFDTGIILKPNALNAKSLAQYNWV